jgi:hypothetical protein
MIHLMRNVFLLLIALAMTQCQIALSPEQEVETALMELLSIVEEADSLGGGYGTQQWSEKDSLLGYWTAVAEQQEGIHLSEEERRELGKVLGRYSIIRMKHGARQIGEEIESIGTMIEGFLEGVLEETKREEE